MHRSWTIWRRPSHSCQKALTTSAPSCWRCHQAKGEQMVPLFGDFGPASQLGVTEYTRERNFRKRLREWLRIVQLYWLLFHCPNCNFRLRTRRLTL